MKFNMVLVEIWKTLNGDYISPSGVIDIPSRYRFVSAKHERLSLAVAEAAAGLEVYELLNKDKNGHVFRVGLFAPDNLVEAQLKALHDQRPPRQIGRSVRLRRQRAEKIELFTQAIMQRYPGCPIEEASRCARWTCKVGAGRAGELLGPEQGVEAAVPAYIRHMHTDYDDRLHEEVANSQEKFTVEEIKQSVRSEVRAKIASILAAWETPPSE